jgi:FkbM family methyltransferase
VIKNKAILSLIWVKKYLYAGKVKQVAIRLGVEQFIKDIWSNTFLYLLGETYTSSLQGTNAEFYIDSYQEYQRISTLINERLPLKTILQDIENGEVFYDIGANIGIYSSFIASHVPRTKILAFEPHSDNVRRLSNNLGLNGNQWSCYQVLLGNKEEMVPFRIVSEKPGESRHSISSTNSGVFTMKRQVDTLVQEENLEPPEIIKIDVEGAELQVLKGAKDTLKNVRIVYCEVHTEDQELEEIKQYFRNSGFRTEELQEDDQTVHIRAVSK